MISGAASHNRILNSHTILAMAGLLVVAMVTWGAAAQGNGPTASADSTYKQAMHAYENGDVDRAKDLMEQVLKLDPDNAEYHYLLGDIQGTRAARASVFSKFGTAKSCKQHFERAVELCPDSVKYLQALHSYHRQAPGIVGGDKQEATRLLGRIFSLDSTAGLWIQAGNALEDKDYSRAERTYEDMLRTGRDTVNVLSALGGLAVAQSKDYGRARAFYFRALAAEPDNQSISYQVARLSVLGKQDLPNAISRLREYLTHPEQPNHPDHAAAFWRMGMAYELLGNIDSARLCYGSALQLRPNFEDAKKSLDALGK